MKLPNGCGSVQKLSGKRRNPWRAVKTKEWVIDPDTGIAKQKRFTIGYYPTRKEALEALMNYNQNPYDIETDTITFKEVYEKWSEAHFQTIVPSACRTWMSAFNHSAPIHNMRMKDIRPNHLEGCIKDADVGQSTKQRMKSLYNMMYRYAMKMEIVDKDYAALCDSVKRGKPEIVRVPFSLEEIEKLKNNIDVPFADMILIGIYTGWRPQELAILKVSDIDMNELTMFGGMKTDAGKNRFVPIHPAIVALVQNRISHASKLGSDYLFNDEDGQQCTYMTYDKYRGRWNKVMKRLHMEHRPHDTRHTFITLGKEHNMDEYILKLIVGHAIQDVTEKTYTHRTMEQLHSEVVKIPDYITVSD